MALKNQKVLIVGGGIAGCSAGIALATAGHSVQIIESQTAWRFQSSGIFVYCNGLARLADLGVLPEILATGYAIEHGRNTYFDHTGAEITETFYPTTRNGQIPAIVGIKRADLHRVLADRLNALGVAVQLGTTVAKMSDEEAGVTVTFSDGSSDTFDLVLGADGIRSATRAMIEIDLTPRNTGFGVWRSVHPRPPGVCDKIMMMGPAKRFGIMPISNDRLYTFGTLAVPKGTHFDPTTWPAQMRKNFAEFSGPAAPFLADLGPQSEVLFTAVEEIIPPLQWHRGKVLLIGDAAHASTPFMGQGGAMAMEDAVVLVQVLNAVDSIDSALSLFNTVRQPMCRFVQDVSRAVGEAGAKEDIHTLSARNQTLAETAQGKVDGFYTKLDQLNAEASAKIPATNKL